MGKSLFGCEGMATLYKSWIRPVLEYGSILYSIAALSHLNCLDCLQAHVENMCGLTFPSLSAHRNASILDLTYHLLAGEGKGSLQSFCPTFKSTLPTVEYLSGYIVLIQLVICIFRTPAIFEL